MKTEIIVASALGVLIGVGILGVRRFLKKKTEEYYDYYADYHRHFEHTPFEDRSKTAYLAMQ